MDELGPLQIIDNWQDAFEDPTGHLPLRVYDSELQTAVSNRDPQERYKMVAARLQTLKDL